MNSEIENFLEKDTIESQDYQLLSRLEQHLKQDESRKTGKKCMDSNLPFLHQIQVQYANTYQLEPTKGVPNTDKLRTILKNLINNELQDFSGRYSAFTAKYYCRIVADLIKNEMKDRVDPRYKIITYKKFSKNEDSIIWHCDFDKFENSCSRSHWRKQRSGSVDQEQLPMGC